MSPPLGGLSGRRIVVTRRSGQASGLVRFLAERGATVLEVPAIEIAPPADLGPLDEALRGLHRFDWVVFPSANAVSAVRERLLALGLPCALSGRGPRLASVGPATSEAIRAAFPDDVVELEPEADFRAAGLVRAFAARGGAGCRILLPVSTRAREELPRGLRGLGAQVEVVPAYATVEPPGLKEAVARCLAAGFDVIAFASPSAVESFASAGGARARGLAAAVIGPTTEAAARRAGFAVRAVAQPSTGEGLVVALERLFPPTPNPV